MLVIAPKHALDLRLVLQYELRPLPYSISTLHGELVKTTKSKLLALLEKDIPPVENVPPSAAWMIDRMPVLQRHHQTYLYIC